MTIRNNVDIRSMNDLLSNMLACACSAHVGTYVFHPAYRRTAKDFVEEFEDAFKAFHKDLQERMKVLGLKISNCDGFREIEALTYGMIKDANPDKAHFFDVPEGFGRNANDDSMGHSVRENVLAGITRDRDFLASLNGENFHG